MGLKRVSIFFLSALVLACAGPAMADEYRAGEFLSLDLSKAALSPKRIGPAAEFAPVAIEARSDAAQTRDEPSVDYSPAVRNAKVKQARGDAAQTRAEPSVDDTPAVRTPKVKHVHIEKPHVPARTKLAHRHGNPLDAQAMDARIHTWPCKSGGICAWKR
jgi:hypothetical protein